MYKSSKQLRPNPSSKVEEARLVPVPYEETETPELRTAVESFFKTLATLKAVLLQRVQAAQSYRASH